jgi:hypothetical protein
MAFFFYSLARPLCSSISLERLLPSHCSFHSGGMSRIDDAYSILWRYLDISLFTTNYTHIYMKRQMTMMITESKHALFLRFSSELVSQFLLIFFYIFQLGLHYLSMPSPLASNLLPTQICYINTLGEKKKLLRYFF